MKEELQSQDPELGVTMNVKEITNNMLITSGLF